MGTRSCVGCTRSTTQSGGRARKVRAMLISTVRSRFSGNPRIRVGFRVRVFMQPLLLPVGVAMEIRTVGGSLLTGRGGDRANSIGRDIEHSVFIRCRGEPLATESM